MFGAPEPDGGSGPAFHCQRYRERKDEKTPRHRTFQARSARASLGVDRGATAEVSRIRAQGRGTADFNQRAFATSWGLHEGSRRMATPLGCRGRSQYGWDQHWTSAVSVPLSSEREFPLDDGASAPPPSAGGKREASDSLRPFRKCC